MKSFLNTPNLLQISYSELSCHTFETEFKIFSLLFEFWDTTQPCSGFTSSYVLQVHYWQAKGNLCGAQNLIRLTANQENASLAYYFFSLDFPTSLYKCIYFRTYIVFIFDFIVTSIVFWPGRFPVHIYSSYWFKRYRRQWYILFLMLAVRPRINYLVFIFSFHVYQLEMCSFIYLQQKMLKD